MKTNSLNMVLLGLIALTAGCSTTSPVQKVTAPIATVIGGHTLSMGPEWKPGTAIKIIPHPFNRDLLGRVVVRLNPYCAHRVVEIQGPFCWTKGDGNSQRDPFPMTYSTFIGVAEKY